MRGSNIARVAIAAAAGAAAASCGNNEPDDRTPPAVVSTQPPAGAVDVPIDATVSAVFSEPMDPSTITTSTLVVVHGTYVETGSVSYDPEARSAVFRPDRPLLEGTTYRAAVRSEAADRAGNRMVTDHTWVFVTVPPADAWEQVGAQVSLPGTGSEDPTMLILGSGPAVGYRHGGSIAYLHTWEGSHWRPPEPDPTSGGIRVSPWNAPAFCACGDRVLMAYARQAAVGPPGEDAFDRVFVHEWTDTAGWIALNAGGEISVPWSAADGGADAREPAIACSSAGTPVAVWIEADVAAGPDARAALWIADVGASSSARSGPFGRNDAVGSFPTDVLAAVVAVAPAGAPAYVAHWERNESEENRSDLFVTAFDGADFAPLGGVLAENHDPDIRSLPSLVAAEGGEVYVAYPSVAAPGEASHVYVRRWSGGEWVAVGDGAVDGLDAATHRGSADPSLLVAGGDVYLAWEENDASGGSFVFVAEWDAAGGSWVVDGAPLNVDPRRPAHDPSIAYSASDGYLYVAFEELAAGDTRIFVMRRPAE